jgi:hypothetical protein
VAYRLLSTSRQNFNLTIEMFTMKNVILGKNMFRSLVLASSLILSAFSVQAGVILSFSEDDIEVGLNETFTVELYADTGSTAPADGIGNFSLDLSFDNSIINLDGFSLGGLFGVQSSFGGTFTPIFSIPPFPPTFVALGSDILLGTFTFTATDYGTTSLRSISESFQNLLFQLEQTSASANVSVVSAPAALGMFVIALAGLVRLRRKA